MRRLFLLMFGFVLFATPAGWAEPSATPARDAALNATRGATEPPAHHRRALPVIGAHRATSRHPPHHRAGARAPAHPAPPPPPPAAPVTPLPTTPPAPIKGSSTGLPLPRFAALRSDDVNLRTGPGTRYPIEWVYKRRDLPVEIEREFDVWRLISDPEGVKGWVHQATLTGRRTFYVIGGTQTLRRAPSDDAAPVAVLKPGVIGRIRSCEAGAAWCEVQVQDYRGWIRRRDFWGTLPDEAVQ